MIDGTNGLFDPSTGYNGLYLGTPGGNGSVSEQVHSLQQLPGNTNATFHTRYDYPVLALDGNLVAFAADDSNSFTSTGNYHGLYTTNLGSHTINKIADVNSTLPGVGHLAAIAQSGVAVSQGSVLFRATDSTPGATPSALYLWKNGTATRIIGTGDTLDGATIRPLPGMQDPGPTSLHGSSFAFNIGGFALYLATPASGSMSVAAVTNSASGGTASISPGEIVTLYGTGLGPSALTYSQLGTNNLFPSQVAGVRILFNGYPAPLIYVSGGQSAAVVPFELDGQTSAQIEVEYNGSVSPSITVPVSNTMPGLFSANASGSGQGAIQNQDGSYNTPSNPATAGSAIVLYFSGLGQLSPAEADGSLSPSSNFPVLKYPVTVTIGGRQAQIFYQGPAPGEIAGVYQIDCFIPAGVSAGNAQVVVTSDSRQSQPNLTVAVR